MQERKKAKTFAWKFLPMDLARVISAPLLLLYRMKRLTPEGKPYKERVRGGGIIAANHSSFSDPFLVGVAVWYRRLFFLAAEAVVKGRLRSWLLKGVGAIKIDRSGADIDAIRKTVEVLKDGRLVSVFPQGAISSEEEVKTLKAGAVLMALQAEVPIIPMYICPRKHWYSRRVVVIGNAINPKELIAKKFPSTVDIERVSQVLLEEMNRCRIDEE